MKREKLHQAGLEPSIYTERTGLRHFNWPRSTCYWGDPTTVPQEMKTNVR